MADAAPYQSLYRRFRPQRFGEIMGQDHVVLALRNAVREERTSHAYLFSGPRGTGKTSAARILAKALNCENPVDGEPDGTCDSCIRIQNGNSFDVHELDAASNNGVDAMRDLTSRAGLGTPGRWKVYIVDEVHMLSTAASNALLKTLEEPPAHVVFVLATTDPQKVLPTIRSRTQHFEFRLLSPDTLGHLAENVIKSAELSVPQEAIDLVVRRGKGSARDTLSALDQVAAAGVVDNECEVLDEITEALVERDTGRALVAIAEAMRTGRDPQQVAVELLEYLRNGFLATLAKQLVTLADTQAERVEDQARRMGTPALVRAMEALGDAMLEMRDSPETRVTLEVAIVRLTKPEADISPAALLERLERLERGGVAPAPSQPKSAPRAEAAAPRPAAQPAPATQPSEPAAQPAPASAPRQEQPKKAFERPVNNGGGSVAPPPPSLGGLRRGGPVTPPPAPQAPALQAPSGNAPEAQPAPAPAAAQGMPTRDQLEAAWQQGLLDKLPQRAKARFKLGRFVSVQEGKAAFALPNVVHRDRCEEVRNEVELVLRDHYGQRIAIELTVDGGDTAPAVAAPASNEEPPPYDDEEHFDIDDSTAAEPQKIVTPADRLKAAFPGAEEVR